MEQAEVQKQIDDALAKARAEWAKTRSWRVMRWDSIKADPQAAAVCALVGYAAAKWGGALTGLAAKLF